MRDSHLTGRTVLGHVMVPLRQLPADCTLDAWLPVEGVDGGRAGEIHLQLTYKVQPIRCCIRAGPEPNVMPSVIGGMLWNHSLTRDRMTYAGLEALRIQ